MNICLEMIVTLMTKTLKTSCQNNHDVTKMAPRMDAKSMKIKVAAWIRFWSGPGALTPPGQLFLGAIWDLFSIKNKKIVIPSGLCGLDAQRPAH